MPAPREESLMRAHGAIVGPMGAAFAPVINGGAVPRTGTNFVSFPSGLPPLSQLNRVQRGGEGTPGEPVCEGVVPAVSLGPGPALAAGRPMSALCCASELASDVLICAVGCTSGCCAGSSGCGALVRESVGWKTKPGTRCAAGWGVKTVPQRMMRGWLPGTVPGCVAEASPKACACSSPRGVDMISFTGFCKALEGPGLYREAALHRQASQAAEGFAPG